MRCHTLFKDALRAHSQHALSHSIAQDLHNGRTVLHSKLSIISQVKYLRNNETILCDFQALKCHTALCMGGKEVPIVEARSRLALAKLLLQHTHNAVDARQHLERAVCICSDDLCLEFRDLIMELIIPGCIHIPQFFIMHLEGVVLHSSC